MRASRTLLRSFAVILLLLEGASGSPATTMSRQPLISTHVAADVMRVRSAAAREWWSVGVHAVDRYGHRYAISATYFRFALGRRDALDTAQVSVLDEATGRIISAERSGRTSFANRLAHSILSIDDWFLATRKVRGTSVVAIQALSRERRLAVALTLAPCKPAVRSLATGGGVSITRLAASGSIITNGRRAQVTGSAWLDHDAEDDTRERPRIGWMRFELQLDDGRDVELFASRSSEGRYWLPSMEREQKTLSSGQVSGGVFEPIGGLVVSKAGRVTQLTMSQVSLVVRANTRWHSPHNEATYPSLWWLSLGGGDPPIEIAPDVLDQELLPSPAGVAIYEGALDVAQAEPPGRHLGVGFVQLSGYATPTSL